VADEARVARRVEAARAHDGQRDIEMAAVSDRGQVRAENQDVAVVLALAGAPGCLALVADGMGGHPDGRLAAELAAAAAAAVVRESPEPAGSLPAAVDAANAAIAERAAPDDRGRSMGTTLVAAVVSGGRATVANVGDSRAYLVRAGAATQISADHSWVAEQIRAGLLTGDEALRHPRRSRVTRALLGEDVEPDLYEVAVRPGDVVLLCSDGLWDALDAARIAALLGDPERPLDEAVAALVDAALAAGSTDNVTAAALRAPAG
jgi:protein phosphatase